MHVLCPNCDTLLKIAGTAGGLLTCPKCKNPFTLPSAPVDDAASENSFAFNPAREDEEQPRKKATPRRQKVKDEEEDDDDRPSRKSSRSGAKKAKSNTRLIVSLVAGVVALLLLGGVGIAVLNKRAEDSKPAPPKAPDDSAQVTPNRPNPTQPGGNQPGPLRGGAPVEVSDLFADDVTLPTPSRSLASLRLPANVVPTPLSLTVPKSADEPKAALADGKLTLDEIKKACVYVKVSAATGGGTGSGFVIRKDGDDGLIATNHHVVRDAILPPERGTPKSKVTVVFDSGLPTEVTYPAEIVAFDPEVDLAVLRIRDVENLPKPIDPRAAVAPSETQPILTCGFPFGESLASGGRNPAITIGKGAVSSLRRNPTGRLEKVQLDAALNPGNSGGPVVDPDGRLVGIAVATIKGSGIGLAVPADDLNAILHGRILYPIFIPVASDEKEAAFSALLPVIDPLGRIKSVSYHIWSGDGKVPAVPKDATLGFRPVPGAAKFDVPSATRGMALREVRVPNRGSEQTVLVQTAITPTTGSPIVSAPVAYRLKVSEIPIATDTVAMSVFIANPARYQGQTVALRANINMHKQPTWGFFQTPVWSEADGAPPPNYLFVFDHTLAADFPDVPYPDRVPARLTVRVGKNLPDGRTPVRIARVDLIGRNDRIVRSMPSGEGADEDMLTSLNREPDRYVGQNVVLETELLPPPPGGVAGPQLFFTLPGGQLPRNVVFLGSPDLTAAVRDLNLKAAKAVRVTATVIEQKANSPTGQLRVVLVQKIELLADDGQAYRVLR